MARDDQICTLKILLRLFKSAMGFLGSMWQAAQNLGSMANNIGATLGSVQGAVKNGINTVSNVAQDVGKTLSDNSGALDPMGLGGVARYVGSGMQSGGQLGNAVANLVGSQSLGDAMQNAGDVYKKGLSFAGDLTNTGKIYSPIAKN